KEWRKALPRPTTTATSARFAGRKSTRRLRRSRRLLTSLRPRLRDSTLRNHLVSSRALRSCRIRWGTSSRSLAANLEWDAGEDYDVQRVPPGFPTVAR